jgi:2,5-diketo-D-gluconate reductase A
MTQTFLTLNNNVQIPQLGLGTWRTPENNAAESVRNALKDGYRLIDTAAIYENETGVGEGLAQGLQEGSLQRDQVFVTTKLWNNEQGYDSVLHAYDASLKRLKLEYVDLYLIHWPAPKKDRYVDSWKALVHLYKEKRVRAIGVSNFQTAHLERVIKETGVTPAVNQIELHPDFQQQELVAFHASHDILTQSWSPLGQGALLKNAAIIAIARKHNKTPAQVIIRWHLEQQLLVIPKSTHAPRITENFAVFDFALDADDLSKIKVLDATKNRIGPHPDTADF